MLPGVKRGFRAARNLGSSLMALPSLSTYDPSIRNGNGLARLVSCGAEWAIDKSDRIVGFPGC